MNSMNNSLVFFTPSPSSPTPIDSSQRPIGVGDFFQVSIGGRAGTGAGPEWTADIADSLHTSGLSDDAVAAFNPGTGDAVGAQGPRFLSVSGHINHNWSDGASLCNEIQRQASANGFAPDGVWTDCRITPGAQSAQGCEVQVQPWLMALLVIGGGIWLLSKR